MYTRDACRHGGTQTPDMAGGTTGSVQPAGSSTGWSGLPGRGGSVAPALRLCLPLAFFC